MPTLTHVAEPPAEPLPAHTATPSAELLVTPTIRRSRRRIALSVVVIAGAAGVIAGRLLPQVFHASVPNVVRASGRIEARETTVAPKDIQGRVARLLVDEGAAVRKGQVLAELEAKQLDARRASLVASVANLDAQISQASLDVVLTSSSTGASEAAAQAAVNTARAHVTRAQAVHTEAAAEYARELELFKEAVVPKSTLDQADMALQTSDADVEAAEREVDPTRKEAL